ncbi:MAG TPA: prepilin-type N-terminal cleavage/methylation domain-containing protein [Candidatus Hydrogenedentes bacterium]|nr:prepilin-type N-terminal cleavage/methylation domain-containing protein [Candidatus Hydrogenedentota bacterium]
MRNKAFTLIELLIVVAIIAILAAIAVPNFLEAQVRSKVSAVIADMRSLNVAYTSYVVDYNKSPILNNNDYPVRKVTTPIAYITSWPIDPFRRGDPVNSYVAPYPDLPLNGVWPSNVQWLWLYPYNQNNATGDIWATGGLWKAYFTAGDPYKGKVGGDIPRTFTWSFQSVGPDRNLELGVFQVYDPTNGTVSSGEVWRLGPE